MWVVYTVGQKGGFIQAFDFETVQEALNAVPILLDLRRHAESFYTVRIDEKVAPDSLENVNGR